MNHSKLVRLLAAGATLLLAVACRPPSPEEIAEETAANTSALITEAGQTAQSVNDMSILDTAAAGVRAASGSPCTPGATGCAAPDAPPPDSFERQVAQITKVLKERIFTKENLESSDAFSATFRVPGSALCSDGTFEPNPTCVDQVERSEIRVRAWPQSGGGVNIQVLVGPDRHELGAFELGKTALAAISDLPQTKKALDHIATITGAIYSMTPEVLEGKVEVRLKKNGGEDFTMSQSVLGAVKVQWRNPQGGVSKFRTAATNPTASLRLEGPKKRITVEVNVGETEYIYPYVAYGSGDPMAGKDLTYFLSGLSGKVVAEEGQQEIVFTNLGLGGGQSYYKIDDKVIASVDVNKDAWRHFDLRLRRDEDGQMVARFSPELDVISGIFYSVLRSYGQQIPQELQDESLRVRLNGSSAPEVKTVPYNPETGFTGGLRIMSGQLTLSTTQSGFEPVVVEAGQCLVAGSSGTHHLLGRYQAAACP